MQRTHTARHPMPLASYRFLATLEICHQDLKLGLVPQFAGGEVLVKAGCTAHQRIFAGSALEGREQGRMGRDCGLTSGGQAGARTIVQAVSSNGSAH